MGLLDDAIREHLELKRRHGAPEAEVDRLTDEVFGSSAPAPADVAPAAGGPARERLRAEAAPPVIPEEPIARAEEPMGRAEEPIARAEEPVAHAEAPTPDLPADAGQPPAAEEAPLPVVEVPADPAPEPRTPSFTDDEPWLDEPDEVPAGESLQHPTQEHEVDSEYVQPDEGPEGEDVLEETPEFLQETPEHDRLWFEQKPPRDFDLGGS